MLDELRRAENVQNRRLATWLTEDEYRSFESDWESQQQIREELRDKPDELKRYEDKLGKGVLGRCLGCGGGKIEAIVITSRRKRQRRVVVHGRGVQNSWCNVSHLA